jgi:hypothetical protein
MMEDWKRRRQEAHKATIGQQLVDLKAAKDAGAITESEYQTQRAKLLTGWGRSSNVAKSAVSEPAPDPPLVSSRYRRITVPVGWW